MRLATVAVATLLLLSGSAIAQTTVPAGSAPAARSTGDARRDTMLRMMRPVTIEFRETRLEDVMRFVTEVTQADIDVMWIDDRDSVGLDKETPVTVNFQKGTVLDLIEKVLEKASDPSIGGGNAWQMSQFGTLQIGPKERLNKWRRLEIYSIADLLLEVPDFNRAPEFDLQAVLQSTGQQGGGSGQSPFRDNQQGTGSSFTKDAEGKTNDLISIITTLVEQDQWVDNGGTAATIRPFQGNLLVNAPDYVHRQVNGYPWWPSTATRTSTQGGRRYVTLGVDSALSKLRGFEQVPVTAVAGDGTLVPSNPQPGGSVAPAEKPATPPK